MRQGRVNDQLVRLSQELRKADSAIPLPSLGFYLHSTALLRCLSECFTRYGRQLRMVSRSSEPLRIVVVDDDSQIREVIGRCLVLFGASVTLCEDVSTAVEAIKRVRPDVVLVDLVMPGRDGFDLLDQIRSWGTEPGGDVPVIVTTGLRDPDLESKVRKDGFAYLAKPFTPIKLFNSITEALGSLPSLKRRWTAFPMVANSGS